MKVTPDVICDLLPLVQSGEASLDTKALVDEFLREHPDWARPAKAGSDVENLLQEGTEPPPELETRTLQRTKRFIRWRSWLMGLGILLMMMPTWSYEFSKTVDGREVSRTEWRMAREHPRLAAFGFGLGVCCWVGWFALRRRLRTTAL